jgi:hypothetical protein
LLSGRVGHGEGSPERIVPSRPRNLSAIRPPIARQFRPASGHGPGA